MNTHATRRATALLLTTGLLAFGWVGRTNATTVLGQTASPKTIVDGSTVPSGTALLSPTVLESRTDTVKIVLTRGQILELDTHSRAYLESTPEGGMEVMVEDGSVLVSNDGERVHAVANQRLVFVEPSIQVAQLGGVAQAAGLLPIVALATGGCTIDAEGECVSSDEGCSSCECKQRNVATGVCEECGCEDDEAIAAAPAKQGLSKGAKIGIGVGAAAGAALLIESLSDDDEPPASPVN